MRMSEAVAVQGFLIGLIFYVLWRVGRRNAI